MYTAVFKKVWIEQNTETFIDISEQIGTIKYTRDKEKDDEVIFTVEQPYISNLSNNVLRRGQTIRFQIGYKGGEKSPVYRARITDISRKYARTVTMTVKARDLGTVMKKSTSVRVWDGQTLSQIAKEIATRYNLEFTGDETTQIYNNYPQSQKDDLSFLRELALREQDGNYEIYVTDRKLVLERRGMDKQSELTFEYGRDQRVISFGVSTKESTQSAASSTSSAITGYDPVKGEVLGSNTTNETQVNNINLGENEYTFSASGELIESSDENLSFGESDGIVGDIASASLDRVEEIWENPAEGRFGSTIVTPYESPQEIKNVSNTRKKSSSLKTTVGKLKVTGQPNMKLNSVVTMAGLEKVDIGNYLITTIVDSVTGTGYTTEISMNKNASKRRNKVTDTTNVENANTTTGANSSSNKSTLTVFNANGELVTKQTSEYKAPK